MDLTWESMGEVWGDFHFDPNHRHIYLYIYIYFICLCPKSPQKGRGHLKHDFRLTERLLPDSTMTYRCRSGGLVVESDRKKNYYISMYMSSFTRLCVYISGVFFFFL